MSTQETKSPVQRLIDWANNAPSNDQAFIKIKKFGLLVEETLEKLRDNYDDYRMVLKDFWVVVDALSCGKGAGTQAMRNVAGRNVKASDTFNKIALSDSHSALTISRIWNTEPNEFLALLNDIASNGVKVPIIIHDDDIKDGMSRAVCALLSGQVASFETKDEWSISDSYSQILRRNMNDAQRLAAFVNFGLYDGRKVEQIAARSGIALSSIKQVNSLKGQVSKKMFAGIVELWRNKKLSVTGPYKTFAVHKEACELATILGIEQPTLQLVHFGSKVANSEKFFEDAVNFSRILHDYIDDLDNDAFQKLPEWVGPHAYEYACTYDAAHKAGSDTSVKDAPVNDDNDDDDDQTMVVQDVDVVEVVKYLLEERSSEFFSELLKQGYYVTQKSNDDV